jgi:hypothetical protein
MPQVGIEPTIPVFELAKTVHVLHRATTVIGETVSSVGSKISFVRVLNIVRVTIEGVWIDEYIY